MKNLKKVPPLNQVNLKLLKTQKPGTIEADELEKQDVEESELDEIWNCVSNKKNQRWLWLALHRRSGKILAYAFGRRTDEVFLELKELLEPFGIQNYCTDGWGAYERHLPAEQHEIGKRKTQQIERKHLDF